MDIIGFTIKATETRKKYAQPEYETLRKLVLTCSLIGSWEEAFVART